MNAAFGGEKAGGIGIPEFEVTQSGGGPCTFVATQFGGSTGGVTASKFSTKTGVTIPSHGGGVGLAAARISTRPQPTTLFGGPGVPHCL
jgi:hypothetical protein